MAGKHRTIKIANDEKSLLLIFNDAYKKADRVFKAAYDRYTEIDQHLNDPHTLTLIADPAARILAIASESSDKMIKIGNLLKDFIVSNRKIDIEGSTASAKDDREKLLDELADIQLDTQKFEEKALEELEKETEHQKKLEEIDKVVHAKEEEEIQQKADKEAKELEWDLLTPEEKMVRTFKKKNIEIDELELYTLTDREKKRLEKEKSFEYFNKALKRKETSVLENKETENEGGEDEILERFQDGMSMG